MVPWRTSNRKALWGTGGIGQHCDCARTCWGVAGSPGGERVWVTGCQNRDSGLGRGQGRHRGDLRHIYWGTWWECHYNRETDFYTSKYLVCTIWLKVKCISKRYTSHLRKLPGLETKFITVSLATSTDGFCVCIRMSVN